MSESTWVISAIAMAFGSVVAAYYSSLPRAVLAPWTVAPPVPFLLNVGGFASAFFSIYLFIEHYGWLKGIGTDVAVGLASAILTGALRSIFPLLVLIALCAIYGGAVVGVLSMNSG